MNHEQIKQSVALITKALPNRTVRLDRMEDMPGFLTNIMTIQVGKPRNGGVAWIAFVADNSKGQTILHAVDRLDTNRADCDVIRRLQSLCEREPS